MGAKLQSDASYGANYSIEQEPIEIIMTEKTTIQDNTHGALSQVFARSNHAPDCIHGPDVVDWGS